MKSETQVFDLEERSAKFGEAEIQFARRIPRDPVTSPLVSQLVRSATSVGANYCEADNAESKRDFRHKIGICRKESREVMHWLRMIATAVPSLADDARTLWQEAKEMHLIFAVIYTKRSGEESGRAGDNVQENRRIAKPTR